jgi:predicted esterase
MAAALPADFRKGERRNVLLAFPPGGQTADLVDVGMRAYWAAEGTRRGWVVISPAAPGGRLFFQRSAKLVEPFETAALRDLGVIADHVALGGISNGGLSAFGAAIARPTHFVAMATLPGAPPGGRDADAVASLKSMRIGLWVGGDDASWLSESRFVYDTLAGMSSVKADVALHVVEGQGHILRGVSASDVWDVIAPPVR